MDPEPHDRLANAFRLVKEYESLDPRPTVDEFLETHASLADLIRPLIAAERVDEPEPARVSGEAVFFGPYQVIETLGEGSFGVVYRALQREPLRREVALKVLKPGMETQEIIARFDAERHALALMNHPSIARVIDAGETDTGQSYFVMELVHGRPLTQFCDEERLTVEERLELFRQVCLAVEHAHRKGVVHRDLKPMNILVTTVEDRPVPKVIDFGIAKAIGRKLTDKTLFTQARLVLGTPSYMSPEQARQTNLDIDHRSDIYALGVLLYELLTGVLPIAFGDDTTGCDLYRQIWEVDPPRPSHRLRSSGGDAAPDWPARLHSDTRSLHDAIRGDLDWVVMKCLEKDRTRRYPTAKDLAADLAHILANEPVVARPPSLAYRLRKLARRNRPASVAATVVLVLVIVGSVLTAGLLDWAQTEKQTETERASVAAEAEARATFLLGVQEARDDGAPEGERWALEEILERSKFPPHPALIRVLTKMYRENPCLATIRLRESSGIAVRPGESLRVRVLSREGLFDWNLESLALEPVEMPAGVAGSESFQLSADGELLTWWRGDEMTVGRAGESGSIRTERIPFKSGTSGAFVRVDSAHRAAVVRDSETVWLSPNIEFQPLTRFETPPVAFRVAFSPSGEATVATLGDRDAFELLIRREGEWSPLASLQERTPYSPEVARSSLKFTWIDGDSAHIFGWFGTEYVEILATDAEEDEQRSRLEPSLGAGQVQALASSGDFLAAASEERRIQVWNRSGSGIAGFDQRADFGGIERPANQLVFSEAEQELVSHHKGPGNVRVWETKSGLDYQRLYSESERQGLLDRYGARFSINGLAINERFLVSSGGDHGNGFLSVQQMDSTGRLATGRPKTELKEQILPKVVGSVAFSPDGAWLAVSDYAGTIRVLETESWRVIAVEHSESTQTAEKVASLCWHPSRPLLLGGSSQGDLLAWDIPTGGDATLHRRRVPMHEGRVSGVAVHPNAQWIASTDPSESGKLVVWKCLDTGPGDVLWEEKVPQVRAPRFLDDRWLAVGSYDRLILFNVETRQKVVTDPRHKGEVYSLAVDPKTGFLASGGEDGRVLLWQVEDGRIEFLETLRAKASNASCLELAFTPNGRYLAAGFQKGVESGIWDLHYYERHIAGNLAGLLGEELGAGRMADADPRVHKARAWIEEKWNH